MANFRDEVEEALFTVLNAQSVLDKATGGVWNTQAPPNIEPPFVVFQHFTKIDDYPTYTIRGASALYMVKAVSSSPFPKEATEIDTLVDAILQDAALSMASYNLLWCRRESDFNQPVIREPGGQSAGGASWSQVGGLYRIDADES